MRYKTCRLTIAVSSFALLGILAAPDGHAETSIAGTGVAARPAVDLSVYYARQLGLLDPTATSFGTPSSAIAQITPVRQQVATASAPPPAGTAKIVLALADVPRVSSSQLGTMRAGFALPNGVSVNFGFDSATFLNGATSPVQVFNITGSAIGSAVSGSVTTQNQTPSTMTVPLTSFNPNSLVTTVNGGLTSIMTEIGTSGLSTVINNQANNQLVQHFQTVNVDISGLSAMLSQQVAQSALSRALGVGKALGIR